MINYDFTRKRGPVHELRYAAHIIYITFSLFSPWVNLQIMMPFKNSCFRFQSMVSNPPTFIIFLQTLEVAFMDSSKNLMVLAAVVIAAVLLQVILIFADRNDTPGKAAVEFSKAYFKLNNGMADYLCSDLTEDEETDVVKDYIDRVSDEARANGFKPSWMKMALSHIEVEAEMIDENSAQVHLTSSRIRAPNPVYGLVSKVFVLGETYQVKETLSVVKEADGWKVCGQPYSLIEG